MNPEGHDDLMSMSKSAARFSAASSVGTVALQVIQVAVLARVLTPTDFAVAAIASILTSFLTRFADFGISSAIVHYQSIEDDELSTLYIVNLVFGALLAISTVVASSWVASFFASPQLGPFLHVLALYIFVATSGSQFRALHQKALDFRTLATAEVGGGLATCVTSIVLALAGFGVMSMAWGMLVGALICSIVLILRGLPLHQPGLRFAWGRSKRFVRYGAYQAGEYALDMINMQMDSLLIGRLTGMLAVGYYAPIKGLCSRLVSVVNPILTRVAFPLMSKIQGDLSRVGRVYLIQVRLIATITCPAYLFALVLAKPLLEVIFGQQWLPAVPILQALSLWGCFISLGNPVGSLLLATGRVRRSLLWNVLAAVVTPAAVLIAAPHGVIVVAWVMLGVQMILFIPAWFMLIRPSAQVGLTKYLRNLWRPLAPAVFAALVTVPTTGLVASAILQLFLSGTVFAGAYVFCSWVVNRDMLLLIIRTFLRTNNSM